MRITNLTNEEILCLIDKTLWAIEQGKSVEIDTFDNMKFIHKRTCYSSNEAGNSNVLKMLSLIDDPFKLRREYHIVIDFEINNHVCNPQELVVSSHTNYVDVETRTYYEFFLVKGDGKQITPSQIYVSGTKDITREFRQNNIKLVRWNAIWDVIIEPIFFEVIGYFLIYYLFSIWLGRFAFFAVFPLVILNILIELVVLRFKFKNKRNKRFLYYIENSTILEICYNNTSNATDVF